MTSLASSSRSPRAPSRPHASALYRPPSSLRSQVSEPPRRLRDSSRAPSREQQEGFSPALPPPSSLLLPPSSRRSAAFTIVEVMMASVILVVGFMGMIQAVTIGSEMLATARRTTLAAQILNHEMEKLRLANWTTINAIADAPAANYDSDQQSIDDAIAASGVTFSLARTTATPTTGLKEITLTVTWTKSGTLDAASTTTGTWLQQLSFSRSTPIARTYTRSTTSWFTEHGLNHAIQRS